MLHSQKRSAIIPGMSTRNNGTDRFSEMNDQEVQALVDRGRRVLAERRLERQGKFKYVLDSRLIDGVRWTKEMKPCGNPKCKKCRERHEYHGPAYKSYVWDGERMRAKSHGKNKPAGWDDPQERLADRGRESRPSEYALPQETVELLRLSEQRYKEKQEWAEAGRWAEFYVAGKEAEHALDAALESSGDTPDDKKAALLEGVVTEAEELYLAIHRRPPAEELTIIRLKIDSGDLKEIWEAAQRASREAGEVVQRFEGYLRSFKALPARYYDDPDAVPRIEKLRAALAQARLTAVEAAQECLDLHEQAMDRLEAAIAKEREEVRKLEASVSNLAVEDLNRSKR